MKPIIKLIPMLACGRDAESGRDNVLSLARYYSDNGADGLFIIDRSQSDDAHERAVGTLKAAVRNAEVPVIAGGRVKRLEDVKKYIYAGAKAVFLDMGKKSNEALIREAAERFGTEKIYAWLPSAQYLDKVEGYQKDGASMMILDAGALTETVAKQIAALPVPFLLYCKVADSHVLNCLKRVNIAGAILDLSQETSCVELKQSLKAFGVSVDTFESTVKWENFKLNESGLIPAIVQDYRTGEVLMLAYMNREAFESTLKTGRMTYYSRSRKALWLKGETSGHFQYVKSLHLDCDNDTILAKVHQIGAACHTGTRSCFFQTLAEKEYKVTNPLQVFEKEYSLILDRKENPKKGSYTNYLFDQGIDKILKKLGEEAAEIIIAAKNPDPEEIKYEISDFLYHMMVLMAEKNMSWEEVIEEIANRSS